MAATKRALDLGFAINDMANRMGDAERRHAYAHTDWLRDRSPAAKSRADRLERAIQRRHKALQRLIRALANLSTGDQLNVI